MLQDLLFRRLLKELRPTLAEYGFRRHSQNFVIESPECWGVINFQKSLYSSAQQKRFTVNVAIAAKRVLRFYNEPDDKSPLHYKCHWEARLGHLSHGSSDRWWTLSDEASYQPVFAEVKGLIADRAVPIVKDHLTEETLLTLWGKNVGGFEYPMLKHKSILLAAQSKFTELPAVFERIREICRGGLAEPGAEQHIAQVRERFCLQVQ
jgi:Domain of unknown function (DUF4304)